MAEEKPGTAQPPPPPPLVEARSKSTVSLYHPPSFPTKVWILCLLFVDGLALFGGLLLGQGKGKRAMEKRSDKSEAKRKRKYSFTKTKHVRVSLTSGMS